MISECSFPTSSGVPCPGDEEMWLRTFVSLLPPGWAFEAADFDETNMSKRLRVLADLFQLFHENACALLPEFVCDTQVLTEDSWFADYDIPDECNINDLCLKVTAIGDNTCASLQELADKISDGLGPGNGIDLCCEAIPPEMQCGQCWDMGVDQMAPQPVWSRGGSELGFASMGFCPAPTCGTDLGHEMLGGEDCNIVGFCYPAEEIIAPDPACIITDACYPWEFVSQEKFTVGCPAPLELNYTGTAYHLKVGVLGSSEILNDPTYAQMGCFEMGCAELCTPPVAELVCFISRFRHAHIVPVPVYC